eukprot:TRINITY_DN2134_c2_g1_i2.p1 TRINITY_DN2134_c2_g1~~TRINITY_DN2134_c2_g1_i2.p1  ORF type:complete len:1422 (+),score=367.59 TRINITY_DN2134_c2_g1_i2:21-4286(+)
MENRYIQIECTFPDDTKGMIQMNPKIRIEQLKKHICSQSPAFFEIPYQEFYLGLDNNMIFENENVLLESYVDIQKYYKYGSALQLVLLPKAVIDREKLKKKKILEKEMVISTKKALLSLKAFEQRVMKDNGNVNKETEQQYFQDAKEVVSCIEKLIEFSDGRKLSVKGVMLTSLSSLMKYAREYFKKPNEFNRVNFENSMKTIGENIVLFIQEFRQSLENMNHQNLLERSISQLKPNENIKGTDIVNRRIMDGRAVKTQVNYKDAELQGFLTKNGGSFKSWKRRWCILKDGFITYFKQQNDEQPLGAIPLEGCLSVTKEKDKKDNLFVINTPYRVYELKADTAEAMDQWVNSINNCILSERDVFSLSPVESVFINTSISFISNVEKEGYLTKSGKNGKDYRKRWCVLKDKIIYYFKTEKDTTNGAPLGVIPLQDSTMESAKETEKSKQSMILIHTRHRTYKLMSDEQTMNEWKELILHCISQNNSLNKEKRLTINVATKNQKFFSIEYKLDKVVQRTKKSYDKNHFPDDKEADIFVEKLLKNTKFHSPDTEISSWKSYLAYILIKNSKVPRKFLKIIAAENTTAPLDPLFPKDFVVYIHLNKCESEVVNGFKITPHTTVEELVTIGIKKLGRFQNIGPLDYVLKIAGKSEYLLNKSSPLHHYVHVRECIKRRLKLEFIFISVEDLKQIEDDHSPVFSNLVLDDTDEKEDCYPLSQVESLFMMKAISVDSFRFTDLEFYLDKIDLSSLEMYLEMELIHSGKRIGSLMRTKRMKEPTWDEIVSPSIQIKQIPKETRVCVTFYVGNGKVEYPMASVMFPLIDYKDRLRTGAYKFAMTPYGKANPLSSVPNYDAKLFKLNMDFMTQEMGIPVVYIPLQIKRRTQQILVPTSKEKEVLDRLLQEDPLYLLSVEEKELLWKYRFYCTKPPYHLVLPKILLSVKWTEPIQVAEIHLLLKIWPKIPPVNALELLGPNFADSQVRLFAIKCLYELKDRELADYLLQLVQAIKCETYHNSALSKFLFTRALLNRSVVGHPFFWHLVSEVQNPNKYYVRYKILLEAYIRGCGKQMEDLSQQIDLVQNLREIASIVKNTDTPNRTLTLYQKLQDLKLPQEFGLPLSPSYRANGIFIKKCKWLDSVTVPLWLGFKNVDPVAPTIYVIFKDGDDLRQDVLTLQMLNIMDKLWKQNDCHLYLTSYKCVATGEDCGFIEVVLNSKTTADIQRSAGGASAVFKKTPIKTWLSEKNPKEKDYEEAVQNFMVSLAGYCVATYVLGIGDRHNDNIMVSNSGFLFHIDFAHFLGNIMKFAGIKRETAPFVLTPEFAYVITGGKEKPEKSSSFQKFINHTTSAYNILRQNANIFISLFLLMLSTGIPELSTVEDLDYLKESFSVGSSDEESVKFFSGLVYESLNTKTTQLNNFFHIIAHQKEF